MATPLGNPGDLSERAKNCLEQSPLLLAEDSKRAGLACARWGVKPQRIHSLHEHNESHKIPSLIEILKSGQNLALISDAGMPVLSDPGYLLVQACRQENIKVTVIPGPCAPVTALAGSGISPQPFIFFGFLPRKTNDREKTIAPYASLNVTLVFFERKDRIEECLKDLYNLLGNREVCIARELTKTHEEYIHFYLKERPCLDNLLGELTVIIGQPLESQKSSEEDIMALLEKENAHGGTPRNIAKRVQAQAKGWTTSDIYTLSSRLR